MLYEKVKEVPGKSTELIPTLSDTVAENVTEALWEEVVSEMDETLEENDKIDGACVSTFVIVILRDLVAILPASSAATAVNVSVVSPKS